MQMMATITRPSLKLFSELSLDLLKPSGFELVKKEILGKRVLGLRFSFGVVSTEWKSGSESILLIKIFF